jgi:hypothetical protein
VYLVETRTAKADHQSAQCSLKALTLNNYLTRPAIEHSNGARSPVAAFHRIFRCTSLTVRTLDPSEIAVAMDHSYDPKAIAAPQTSLRESSHRKDYDVLTRNAGLSPTAGKSLRAWPPAYGSEHQLLLRT